MSDSKFRIECVGAPVVRPLRHAVLRPGQPAERLVYPGDDAASTVHLGAFSDGEHPDAGPVSVASFYDEPLPERVDPTLVGLAAGHAAIRIRGMATNPAFRGQGLGRTLMERGLELMQANRPGNEPGAAWCNARLSAAGYYQRIGFEIGSPEFELPDIGPHLVMVRRINANPIDAQLISLRP